MMSLLLGKRADPINERKCLLEVGKSEGAAEVVFVSDVPARDFLVKVLQIDAFERGDVAAAGNAGFGGEGHTVPMINLLVMRFQPRDFSRDKSSYHPSISKRYVFVADGRGSGWLGFRAALVEVVAAGAGVFSATSAFAAST